MYKNIILSALLLSTLFSQIKNEVTINVFKENNSSLIINNSENGLYKNHFTQTNITFGHYFSKPSSKISLFLKWYIKEDQIDILKLAINYKHKNGTTKIGMFSKEKIYQSSDFTTGSMVFSENSSIVPGIGFNSEWKSIGKLIDLKGIIFQGKFPNQINSQEGPFLHYKSILLKKNFTKTKLGLQIQHAVQFGGFDENGDKIPVNPRLFFRMIAAQKGDESQPGVDRAYKIGNGVGAYIFNFEHDFTKVKFKIYHEHYFDDKSGAKMKNLSDGLYGLELNSKKGSLLYEVLDTRNQSGRTHPPGVDSYYWHSTYEFGWTNEGLSLGNSFIGPNNNRKFVQNYGLQYQYNEIKIMLRFIDSKEYLPYLNKNNNQPYEGINVLLGKNKYQLLGAEFNLKNERSMRVLLSNDRGIKNIKLSYCLTF